MRAPAVALLFALLGAAPGATSATHAAQLGTPRTAVTAHGVRLTLALPGRSFPRNALVHADATVRNVTRDTVWLLRGGPPSPGKSMPQVEVFASAKRVYPPALSWWLPLPGPGPGPFPLKPGQTLRAATYVILRGARVHATVDVMRNRNAIGNTRAVTTPLLRVTLTTPDPPTLTMIPTPGGPQEKITPPAGVSGRPLVEFATECAGPAGGVQTLQWTRAPSDTLVPGCIPMLQWHLVAGWPGHSVATVDLPTP